MSTGWTQSRYQESAYAPYDDTWPGRGEKAAPWQDEPGDPEGQGDPGRWAAGLDDAEPRRAGPHAGPWVPQGRHYAEPQAAGSHAEPWAQEGQDYARPRPAGSQAGAWAPQGQDYAEPRAAGPWVAQGQDYPEPWVPGQGAEPWTAGPGEARSWTPGRGHERWLADSGGYPEPWAQGHDGDVPAAVAPGGGWAQPEPWSAGQPVPSQPAGPDHPGQAAQAVASSRRHGAGQSRDEAEAAYQQDWDRAGGDSAEDADYDWYRYLGQGLSANAKPGSAPAERPSATRRGSARSAHESGQAARRGDRRLGRRKPSGTVPDADARAADRTNPGYRWPEQAAGPAYETHPGMSFRPPADSAPFPGQTRSGGQFPARTGEARFPGETRSGGQFPAQTDGAPFLGQTGPGVPFPRRADPGMAFSGPSAAVQVPAERAVRGQAPAAQVSAAQVSAAQVPAARAPSHLLPDDHVTSRPVPGDRSEGKPARDRPGRQGSRSEARARRAGRSGKRFRWRFVGVAGGAAVLAATAAAAASLAHTGSGVAHVMVSPAKLGSYVQEPSLARDMGAAALQKQIVASSSGEAKHVVYAVYEDATGRAARHGPQIILFIGGNRSGTSASSFMSSFAGKLAGAATTSPGSMGGAAACVPSVAGRLAECAWADDDTFGVVASPTLSAAALASELRTVRPLVEKRTSRPG